ncbi:MAG: hypothetical protein NTV06_06610, partial [candidate division Zixibacteria bacterium]|nr:hypothetical protein [candidate division Zixibacteria bacterium]
MNKTICTLRDIPQPVNIGGDYYITQSALMLGSMAEGEVRLKNADRSKDTKLMIALLKSMGCQISVGDSEIIMSPSNSPVSLDGKEIHYGGGVYPLALVIGYLAGKGRKCTLNYTNDINPIFIAKLTKSFSEIGIGLKHNNESHHIEFGQNQLIPIEREISAVFPHTKDSLLMLGLSSGRSVAIREKLLSDIKVENIIIKLGGKLTFRETKPELVDNPDDPRKKLRQARFSYKREMILHPSTHLRGAVIEVPADSYQLAAWLALAILKKTEFRSEGLHITAETKDFVNYLKSAGAGISLAKNSSPDSGIKKIDLYLGKSEISGRKISGNTAAGLMKKIALMAILAAGRPATTLIRDIKEY